MENLTVLQSYQLGRAEAALVQLHQWADEFQGDEGNEVLEIVSKKITELDKKIKFMNARDCKSCGKRIFIKSSEECPYCGATN